jgi:hypothetical protein
VERYVVGTVAVILGILMIVFRRPFAEQVHSSNRFMGVRMGPEAEAAFRKLFVVGGAGFILAGLLMLAGIGRMQS